MNRFEVTFSSLLVFASLTTALAGWGLLIGSASQSSAAQSAASSMMTSSVLSSSGSVQSYNSSEGSIAASTTTATFTTVTTSSIETSTATVTGTAAGGAIAAVTTTVTSTIAGAGATTVVTTATAAAQGNGALWAYSPASSSQGGSLLREAQADSMLLAPVSWVLLAGAWIWRGRVRSRYTEMGFGSDVFELFMKMKGGATRIKVLNTLSTPKDRLQLAEELGVDWKTVDRHVQILNRYGFVREQAAYGTVRLYEMTPMGRMLLNLFDELERTDGPVFQQQQQQQQSRVSTHADERPGSTT